MRDRTHHILVHKRAFEALIFFYQQYEGNKSSIKLSDFQTYLSNVIGTGDPMRENNEKQIIIEINEMKGLDKKGRRTI